jgi:quercetin dioxygenase-like cupin family protein
VVTREHILKLQEAMLHIETEAPEPNHYFANGMYLRELTIPAGALIVGKTHKHEHFLIVTRGRAMVVSEFGEEEVEAGYVGVSPPGAKRAILALEETTFLTTHVNGTNTQDLKLIEEEHIVDEHLQLARDRIRGLLT